jgi:hypothetical protein
MVKILEQLENQKSAMMDSSHEGQSVGSSTGVCNGVVNQALLLQNEYLAAENRILCTHLPARRRLSDPERCTLAEIGERLRRKALEKMAFVAKPATILVGYRRLIARKFDGSRCGTNLSELGFSGSGAKLQFLRLKPSRIIRKIA